MTKSYNGHYILEEDRQYNLILFRQEEVQSVGFSHYEHIPAWSLHRLLLLCDVTAMFTRDILETAYDDQINAIENIIKNGYFNKEYLKK